MHPLLCRRRGVVHMGVELGNVVIDRPFESYVDVSMVGQASTVLHDSLI